MIQILNNNISRDRWCEISSNSRFTNYFQTPQCYDFFQSLSFLEAFAFGVEEGGVLKGVIVGYIQKDGGKIKQYLSRRAIITGGPLLANDISDEALKALLDNTRKCLSSKAIYIETRNFNDYSEYKKVFASCGFDYIEHLNFHVDTTSIDIVNANLGKSRKRDIKTSIRDGAIVVNNPTIEQLREYYTILEELYLTKVRTPLFPFEFFEKLHNLPEGIFCLIELNGEIIGGTVCVALKNIGLYELFACGLDGKYKNIYPSTLATFSAIEYAANNGYKRFDMMGAGKPKEAYGVRNFKAKFGGELVEHGRFLCVVNLPLYNIGKLGVKILKGKK